MNDEHSLNEDLSYDQVRHLLRQSTKTGLVPDVYDGKTRAWRGRFKSWAGKMLEQDYFDTLVETLLAHPVYFLSKGKTSYIQNNQIVSLKITMEHLEYYRGYIAALRDLELRIKSAAAPQSKHELNQEGEDE